MPHRFTRVSRLVPAIVITVVLLTSFEVSVRPALADDDHPQVPGVIIDDSPAASGRYIGCPAIAILPDGRYVASHSFFGPGTTHDETWVFGSEDRGKTWQKMSEIKGQFWSNLFVHRGSLYIMGVDRQWGNYKLEGSVTGFDGQGNNIESFTSNSGQIIVPPDLWRRARDRNGQAVNKTGDLFTWKVCRTGVGTVDFRGDGEKPFRAKLIQNFPNAEHTLELVSTGGKVRIDAFDVFEPALR